MKLSSVIRLLSVSDSVDFRGYESTIGGKSILRLTLEYLVSQAEPRKIHLVAGSNADAETVRSIADGIPVSVAVDGGSSPGTLLSRILDRDNVDCVEWVPLLAAILPAEYLGLLRMHHAKCRNDFSHSPVLPEEVSPCIISLRLARLLADLPPHLSGVSIRQIVFRSIELFGEGFPTADGDGIRMVPFDFPNVYGIGTDQIPMSISFDTPTAAEWLRKVLDSTPAGVDALRNYKTAIIRKVEQDFDFSRRPRKKDRSQALRKILFVQNRSAYSGGEESLIQMIGGLDRERFQAEAVVSLRGVLSQRLEGVCSHVHSFDQDFSEPRVLTVARFDRLLDNSAPDLIHLNAACGPAILIAASRLGIPVIQHVRNMNFRELGESLFQSARLICVSEYCKEFIGGLEFDRAKVRIVHNGVDIDRFWPGVFCRKAMRKQFEIPLDSNVVLCIARFAPNKRHDLLIKSFRTTLESLPNSILLLVGEAIGEKGYVEAITKQIDSDPMLRSRVRHVGFQTDIRQIECIADIQVLCSESEPLGRCLLESMALGIPVIASTKTGMREIIVNGETGFVTPAGDANALAGRCIELLSNPALRRKLGENARSTVVDKYSSKHSAAAMMSVYDELVHPFSAVNRLETTAYKWPGCKSDG